MWPNQKPPNARILGGMTIRPENSDLSEASLEELCIAIVKLRDKTGNPLNIVPTHWVFTEEALRKFFGWTDADFQRHG